jgi:hypothetical protein
MFRIPENEIDLSLALNSRAIKNKRMKSLKVVNGSRFVMRRRPIGLGARRSRVKKRKRAVVKSLPLNIVLSYKRKLAQLAKNYSIHVI